MAADGTLPVRVQPVPGLDRVAVGSRQQVDAPGRQGDIATLAGAENADQVGLLIGADAAAKGVDDVFESGVHLGLLAREAPALVMSWREVSVEVLAERQLP